MIDRIIYRNPKEVLRRLATTVAISSGILLTGGCTSVINNPPQNESSSSPTTSPTIPTTLTTAPEQKSEATKAPDPDTKTRRLIQEAKAGEIVTIDNAFINRVIRAPWLTGTATIATLGINLNGDTDTIAVLTQADCVFDALRKTNKLGNAHLGTWEPQARIEQLTASVSIPPSIAEPVPILDLKTLNNGEPFTCHEVTAAEQLKNILRKVDWKNAPENIAAILGSGARGIFDGLKKGFTTP